MTIRKTVSSDDADLRDYREWTNAQRAEHPTWRDPPQDDTMLRWRFCYAEAEMGIGSGFGAIEALGLSGVTVRGCATGDAKMVGRRVVSLAGEVDMNGHLVHSPAEKVRTIDTNLMQLSQEHRLVLWLAYGPDNYHPQVKKEFETTHCGVALASNVAKKAHTASKSKDPLGTWLMHGASKIVLARVKVDMRKMLFVAWNEYADRRGRKRRVDRKTEDELEEMT